MPGLFVYQSTNSGILLFRQALILSSRSGFLSAKYEKFFVMGNSSQFDHNTGYYSINNGHLQSFGSCDKDLTSNTCEWYLKTDKERQILGLESFIPAILHCLYWPRQLKNRVVPSFEIISSICGRKKKIKVHLDLLCYTSLSSIIARGENFGEEMPHN